MSNIILSYNKSSKLSFSWISVLLSKTLGYSSFIVTIVSLIMYCYKKHSKKTIKTKLIQSLDNPNESELLIKSSRRPSGIFKQLTPPLSPIPSYYPSQSFSKPNSPNHSRPNSPRNSRPNSPLNHWSTRMMDNVMSTLIKRKKMTISLKNTILWNPSPDLNTPIHAFHENAVFLLYKLAQKYDLFILIHIRSNLERQQIQTLLKNTNLIGSHSIESSKIIYCQSETEKQNLIQSIQPNIHIEGGWERQDGLKLVQKIKNVSRFICILPPSLLNQSKSNPTVEYVDHILHSSVAKKLGF